VIVMVIFGAVVAVRSAVRKKADEPVEGEQRRISTYVPSGSGVEPAGGQPVGIGVRRWLRSGTEPTLVTADLAEVLERAVRHHRQSGWSVTIDCRETSVIVDAERLEKVVRTLVAGASLRGAPHVGLTAADTESMITVAVVDDGPLGWEVPNDAGPDTPVWVGRQLAALGDMLQGSGISAEWMAEDGLSVFVLSWHPIESTPDVPGVIRSS